jgi:hypothetical protein
MAKLVIVGYATNDMVKTSKVALGRSKGAKHWNYEVPWAVLSPIEGLIAMLREPS